MKNKHSNGVLKDSLERPTNLKKTPIFGSFIQQIKYFAFPEKLHFNISNSKTLIPDQNKQSAVQVGKLLALNLLSSLVNGSKELLLYTILLMHQIKAIAFKQLNFLAAVKVSELFDVIWHKLQQYSCILKASFIFKMITFPTQNHELSYINFACILLFFVDPSQKGAILMNSLISLFLLVILINNANYTIVVAFVLELLIQAIKAAVTGLKVRNTNKWFYTKEQLQKQYKKLSQLLLPFTPIIPKTLNHHKERMGILFCYLQEFEQILKEEGQNIVNLMNKLYKQFDYFCTQEQASKITNIGKLYLAVAAENHPNQLQSQLIKKNQSQRLLALGLKMITYAQNIKWGTNKHNGIKIKIGIHFGDVLIDAIGENKTQQTIFGYNANITSRLASTADQGTINISKDAKQRIFSFDTQRFEEKFVYMKGLCRGKYQRIPVYALKPQKTIDNLLRYTQQSWIEQQDNKATSSQTTIDQSEICETQNYVPFFQFQDQMQILQKVQQLQQKLKNQLPKNIFQSLLSQGLESTSKKIDVFKDCTILFADIKGFTQFSDKPENKVEPGNILRMLKSFFQEFDLLCPKYRIFKVCTIGDCYVALGCANLEDRNYAKEAENVIKFGFQMQKIIKNLKKSRSELSNLDIRIGVHTGVVFGGLIGSHSIKYDVFSCDVAFANKLQETGKVGKIHISQKTKNLIEKLQNKPFNEYTLEEGSEVSLQNGQKKLKGYFIYKPFQSAKS